MKIDSYLFLVIFYFIFFYKIPRNSIIKTVVWKLSLNCANSYLNDMSRHVINLLHLGPTVVAQTRDGGGRAGIQASEA